MKLVDLETGEEIKPNNHGELICKRGKVKGDKFKFGKLVAPTEENPNGLVISKLENGKFGWTQFYPSVFNAKIIN